MTKNLTCIICPMGCQLEVDLPDDWTEENMSTADPASFVVRGNTCPRGSAYAGKELKELLPVQLQLQAVQDLLFLQRPEVKFQKQCFLNAWKLFAELQ